VRVARGDQGRDPLGIGEAHVAAVEPGPQEPGQRLPEQERSQVVQLRQAECVRREEELAQRHQLKGLGEYLGRPAAYVVGGEAEVRMHVREDLRQVAGLPVIGVVVQEHDRDPGRLESAQQVREQERIAPVQVDVPVAVPDVELDGQSEFGAAPDEEPVQRLVRQSRRRPAVSPAVSPA
jgi:hypothetical protein